MLKMCKEIFNYILMIFSLCLVIPVLSYAGINDVAVFAPKVENWMTVAQQNDLAAHLKDNVSATSIQIYSHSTQAVLVTWMNINMSDGESDVLLIMDLAPSLVFAGEQDGSLAEQWIDNGNLLIWTGSEAFHSYVDPSGVVSEVNAGHTGANKVLDIKGEGLCTGYATTPQLHTNVSTNSPEFFNYLPSLNLNYSSADGSMMRSLKYIDIVTKAESVVSWDDAPNMLVDEMFAENSDASDTTHVYESDAIVLTKRDIRGEAGQYAQFYCYKGLVDGTDVNEHRKPVLAEFLNNWVATPINLIWVDDDAAFAMIHNGTVEYPYTTIQEGIDAAEEFGRDRVIVKAGLYYEQLNMRRSVKVMSDDSGVGETRETDPAQIPGFADSLGAVSKKPLKRALRTIVDGTGGPSGIDGVPMAEFPRWSGLGTWLDGFNVRNMPKVNHEIPGHAHVIQTRGASGTIVDNVVHNNGSSGLGSHAWFYDQEIECPGYDSNTPCRDFSYSNVQYNAHPVLVNNIVYRNEGNNLGNNHYSYALMYHNECFGNISFHGHASPGIGCQHGAHPYVYDNLVYSSSWAGIGGKRGWPQGRCEGTGENATRLVVDRPTRPTVINNMVFNSGWDSNDPETGDDELAHGAGIGGDSTGGYDEYSEQYIEHLIEGNYVDGAAQSAIGCRYATITADYLAEACNPADDDLEPPDVIDALQLGWVRIKNNVARNGGTIGDLWLMGAGIGIDGIPHVMEISGNEVSNNAWAGIGVRDRYKLSSETYVALINNNMIHNNGMDGIGIREGAWVGEISDNTVYNNRKTGISAQGEGTYRDLVTNNTCYNNGMAGIGAKDGAASGMISFNVSYENNKAGIGSDNSGSADNPVIIENNIVHNNQTVGIGLSNGSFAIISGNHSSDNKLAGIMINKSHALANNNTVFNNKKVGIGCYSGQAVISNNYAYGNYVAGISLNKAKKMVVVENRIIKNGDPNDTTQPPKNSPFFENKLLEKKQIASRRFGIENKTKEMPERKGIGPKPSNHDISRQQKRKTANLLTVVDEIFIDQMIKRLKQNKPEFNHFNGAGGVGVGMKKSVVLEFSKNTLIHNRLPGLSLTDNSIIAGGKKNLFVDNGINGTPNISLLNNSYLALSETEILKNNGTNIYLSNSRLILKRCRIEKNSSHSIVSKNKSSLKIDEDADSQ